MNASRTDEHQTRRTSLKINERKGLGAPGFEPGITGPKPVALPLGHAPIRCKSSFAGQSDRPPATLSHMGWAGLSYQYRQGSAMHRFGPDDSCYASAGSSADGLAAVADRRDGGIKSTCEPPQSLLPQTSGRHPANKQTIGTSGGLRRGASRERRGFVAASRRGVYIRRTSASRSVAQPGSAPASGAGGREFESPHSDHCPPTGSPQGTAAGLGGW